MTERFVNKGKDIFQYGEWWCSAGGEHCADVIATALNRVINENEQLKNENQKLDEKICLLTRDLIKTKSYEQLEKELNRIKNENKQLKHNNRMLSMKMSEVYTNYRLLKEFSEDTNPNDAVKRVLSELMQITKEYR